MLSRRESAPYRLKLSDRVCTRRVADLVGSQSATVIHRRSLDSGDARVMDPGDATRGYPLDFGDTH
jgi:hypothetical protein